MYGIVRRGARAVARRPARHDLQPERGLLRRADAVILDAAVVAEADGAALVDQKLRIPHQLRVVLDEPARADPLPHLLVRRRQEDHIALQRHAGALQHHQRHQLRDPFPLHVLGTAAPDVPVLDQPPEGIDGPVLRRRQHDVHVVEQDDGAGGAVAAQARVQIRLAGRGLEHLRLDALARQHRGQPVRRATLVARRVGRVDPQILGQQLGRVVPQGLPLVGTARRGDQRDPLRKLHHRRGRTAGQGRNDAMGAGDDHQGATHGEPVTSHGTDSGSV